MRRGKSANVVIATKFQISWGLGAESTHGHGLMLSWWWYLSTGHVGPAESPLHCLKQDTSLPQSLMDTGNVLKVIWRLSITRYSLSDKMRWRRHYQSSLSYLWPGRQWIWSDQSPCLVIASEMWDSAVEQVSLCLSHCNMIGQLK